jgi:hypothetical protein
MRADDEKNYRLRCCYGFEANRQREYGWARAQWQVKTWKRMSQIGKTSSNP